MTDRLANAFSMLTLSERQELAKAEKRASAQDQTDVPNVVRQLRREIMNIEADNDDRASMLSEMVGALKLRSNYKKAKHLSQNVKDFAIEWLNNYGTEQAKLAITILK